jgi:hypothetical protein
MPTGDEFEPRVSLPPEPPAAPRDEAVAIRIGVDDGKVVVAFSEPTLYWVLSSEAVRQIVEAAKQVGA